MRRRLTVLSLTFGDKDGFYFSEISGMLARLG